MLKIEEFMILKLQTIDSIRIGCSESEVLENSMNLKEKLKTTLGYIRQRDFNFNPNLRGHDVNSIGDFIISSNITTRKLETIKKESPKEVSSERKTELNYLKSNNSVKNFDHHKFIKETLRCRNVRCGNTMEDKEIHDGYCHDCFRIFKIMKNIK